MSANVMDMMEHLGSNPYYSGKDGEILIYHGDSPILLANCADGCVDAVITDPPYGDHTHDNHLGGVILEDGEPAGQALGFHGIPGDECVDLAQMWCRLATRWVVFSCEWHYAHLLEDAGLLIRLGIWRKPDGAPQFTGDRPGMGWEGIAICHRKGMKRWNGGGKHAFWEYPKGENKTGHPTGKPLGLLKEVVADFTDEGDLILDPFMGSGTTGAACAILGRRFIGIDIKEEYCEMAARRIERTLVYPEYQSKHHVATNAHLRDKLGKGSILSQIKGKK